MGAWSSEIKPDFETRRVDLWKFPVVCGDLSELGFAGRQENEKRVQAVASERAVFYQSQDSSAT